ncbi:transcriptional adapter 1 [Striga asiatica]|uniref:Transcriptional adapter 1 n=1 Tax=Striga asiatica TaxID=4170 RepID=A0A5A7R8J2_STRAF|nr:transcriptional adapter 1 [Striga asiatica]
MATANSRPTMRKDRHCPRVDTLELKHHIQMKLGHHKSEKYFNLLNKYLTFGLSKSEFDRFCIELIGKQNLPLHNKLIRAILKNACAANSPPPGKDSKPAKNGYQNSLHLLRDVFPQSPRKGRSPSLRHRMSPLGPNAKAQIAAREEACPRIQEQQSATEIFSLGSRPPVEVTSEEGEEVEQMALSPGIHSRTELKAPFGVRFNSRETKKFLSRGFPHEEDLEACYNNTGLLSTGSLRKRLDKKLGVEGLTVSAYCVNLINNGLDVYLKRLIKPCLDLAASRSVEKTYVSFADFEVAMQSNPRILGEDWPVLLEKVGLRVSDNCMG